MQEDKIKSLHLSKVLGELIKEIRLEQTSLSINKFADEYDISRGNLSKIEAGKGERKLVTVWKLAEALGLTPSELVRKLEEKLGENFKLIDE